MVQIGYLSRFLFSVTIGLWQKNDQLEARVERLENELAAVKSNLDDKKRNHPWHRQIVGDFANDKDYAEIIGLCDAIRRGENKE